VKGEIGRQSIEGLREVGSGATHDGKNLFRYARQKFLANLRRFLGQKIVHRTHHAFGDEGVRAAEIHLKDIRRDAACHHHHGRHLVDDIFQFDALGSDKFDAGVAAQEFLLDFQGRHACGIGGSRRRQTAHAERDRRSRQRVISQYGQNESDPNRSAKEVDFHV
jgi:hypothetical protein